MRYYGRLNNDCLNLRPGKIIKYEETYEGKYVWKSVRISRAWFYLRLPLFSFIKFPNNKFFVPKTHVGMTASLKPNLFISACYDKLASQSLFLWRVNLTRNVVDRLFWWAVYFTEWHCMLWFLYNLKITIKIHSGAKRTNIVGIH